MRVGRESHEALQFYERIIRCTKQPILFRADLHRGHMRRRGG
jgi:hypothetical protein